MRVRRKRVAALTLALALLASSGGVCSAAAVEPDSTGLEVTLVPLDDTGSGAPLPESPSPAGQQESPAADEAAVVPPQGDFFTCRSRFFRQITARFSVPLFLSDCSHFALPSPQYRHCSAEASCNAPFPFPTCSRKFSGSTFFFSKVRHFRNVVTIPGNRSLFCHLFLSFSDALSTFFSCKF